MQYQKSYQSSKAHDISYQDDGTREVRICGCEYRVPKQAVKRKNKIRVANAVI